MPTILLKGQKTALSIAKVWAKRLVDRRSEQYGMLMAISCPPQLARGCCPMGNLRQMRVSMDGQKMARSGADIMTVPNAYLNSMLRISMGVKQSHIF